MEKRKLYILCACILPLAVCSGVIYSMFSLYLHEVLAAERSQIGLIYMCGSLAGFFSAPHVGNLADKFGKKIVILLSIASFTLIFLFYSLVRDYRLVYAIQALEGSSWAAYGAAATAYVADIISPERRGWAMGVYQRAMSLGWIIGPAIAGFFFEIIGFSRTFFIGAVITGMSIIPAFLFIKEMKPSDKGSGQQSTMLK